MVETVKGDRGIFVVNWKYDLFFATVVSILEYEIY